MSLLTKKIATYGWQHHTLIIKLLKVLNKADTDSTVIVIDTGQDLASRYRFLIIIND